MDINEYNKYKNDKVKFASKFFHAADKRRGKYVKKSLYDHQKVMLKSDDFLLIKKERQAGITEVLTFEIAYHLNYTHDYNMLVYCASKNQAEYMKYKVIRHFSNIPDNIRVGQMATLKTTFTTDINSCVEFRHGDTNIFGCAQTYDAIYAEDADFIKDFENAYKTLAPCVSRKGRMIITATSEKSNSTLNRLWNSKNVFNKLLVTTISHSYNAIDKKSLSSLSKEQYDKIIHTCVIL